MNKIMVIAFLILLPAMVTANDQNKKNDTIAVDIVTGKIGDVKYRASINAIKKAIGGKRIKKSVEDLEGRPSDVFIIDIKGHKIFKHWNVTSFTDSVFKMRNGVSTGMKIKDFRKQYGNGEIMGGEGTSLCFEQKTPKYGFCVPAEEYPNKIDNLIVNEIWVW